MKTKITITLLTLLITLAAITHVNAQCIPTTWYRDADQDLRGDAANAIEACAAPAGYVADNTDCDDTNASIHGPTTWYRDSDNDGSGDPNDFVISCIQPSGYVSNNWDPLDSSPAFFSNDGRQYYWCSLPKLSGSVISSANCGDSTLTLVRTTGAEYNYNTFNYPNGTVGYWNWDGPTGNSDFY